MPDMDMKRIREALSKSCMMLSGQEPMTKRTLEAVLIENLECIKMIDSAAPLTGFDAQDDALDGVLRAELAAAEARALAADAAALDAVKAGKLEGLREAAEACREQRTAWRVGQKRTAWECGNDSAVIGCVATIRALAARVEGGDA